MTTQEREPGTDGRASASSLEDRIDGLLRTAASEGRIGPDDVERSPSGAPSSGHANADLFSTDEIFQRLAATADDEFRRPARNLVWSGVAAGLAISLTFLARMALGAGTGSGGQLPGDLLYPLGFVLVVLGRYQLFTENTLTPVTLVLTRIASIPALLRLWGWVLLANLVGAAVGALLFSAPGTLTDELREVGVAISAHALDQSLATLFVRGVVAGGIVASMVWLVHAVRESTARILIVYLSMILIPTADLFHCITGFCEVLFGVLEGAGTLPAALGFLAAVVAGNVVGGVVFVALVNYGQTAQARFPDRDHGLLELEWQQLLFGFHTGRPAGSRIGPAESSAGRLTGTSG